MLQNVLKSSCTLQQLYSIYFRLLKTIGLSFFQLDLVTNTIISNGAASPWFYLHYACNTLIILFIIAKQLGLFAYNYWTEFKYDTIRNGYIFQILWILGVGLYSSIFFHSILQRKKLGVVITSWIRLEKHILDFFHSNSSDESPNSNNRLIFQKKMILAQYILAIVAIIFCVAAMMVMNAVLPDFPAFINSLYLRYYNNNYSILGNNSDINEFPTSHQQQHNYQEVFLHLLIKTSCQALEVYLMFIAWSCICSFDILLRQMSESIYNLLHLIAIHISSPSYTSSSSIIPSKLNINLKPQIIYSNSSRNISNLLAMYKSLELLTSQMNQTFSTIILIQEGLNFMTGILLFYGIIHSTTSIPLTLFFMVNAICITARIFIFIQPIARFRIKSQTVLKKLNDVVPSCFNRYEMKKLRTCRCLCIRPGGLHTILYDTIFDYIFATISNVLILIEI